MNVDRAAMPTSFINKMKMATKRVYFFTQTLIYKIIQLCVNAGFGISRSQRTTMMHLGRKINYRSGQRLPSTNIRAIRSIAYAQSNGVRSRMLAPVEKPRTFYIS